MANAIFPNLAVKLSGAKRLERLERYERLKRILVLFQVAQDQIVTGAHQSAADNAAHLSSTYEN